MDTYTDDEVDAFVKIGIASVKAQKNTEQRVIDALKGLVKVVEVDNNQISIWGKPDHAYNISSVTVNAMVDAGFFLSYITLTQDNKPKVVFTTFKI